MLYSLSAPVYLAPFFNKTCSLNGADYFDNSVPKVTLKYLWVYKIFDFDQFGNIAWTVVPERYIQCCQYWEKKAKTFLEFNWWHFHHLYISVIKHNRIYHKIWCNYLRFLKYFSTWSIKIPFYLVFLDGGGVSRYLAELQDETVSYNCSRCLKHVLKKFI